MSFHQTSQQTSRLASHQTSQLVSFLQVSQINCYMHLSSWCLLHVSQAHPWFEYPDNIDRDFKLGTFSLRSSPHSPHIFSLLDKFLTKCTLLWEYLLLFLLSALTYWHVCIRNVLHFNETDLHPLKRIDRTSTITIRGPILIGVPFKIRSLADFQLQFMPESTDNLRWNLTYSLLHWAEASVPLNV
jgi:hypothetical protein